MLPTDSKLTKFLLEGGFITDEQLQICQIDISKKGVTLEESIVRNNILKDNELGQLVAEINGWHFIDLSTEALDKKVLKEIPQEVAEKQKVIAFKKGKKGLKIAMSNPGKTKLIHLLAKTTGHQVEVFYATPFAIKETLHLYQEDISNKFQQLIKSHSKEIIGGKAEDSAVVGIVNLLITQAYEKQASDIHIEPSEEESIVRFRVDGVLHDIVTVPKNIHNLLITRIKIMSNLRTDEHQVPQDGKIKFQLEDGPADIRISVVPTTKGENVVMRLLAEKSRQYTLEEVGLGGEDYKRLSNSIKKPWGMILVTGPTGAGKTTTLYAVLKILNKRSVNIATIEDPVEYNVDGVTQIQVNSKAKLTFSSGLKSIVRQDPDVIMVGEIRDKETASIAVNSAMTGHLVLSTLHTNDAATTLPRILEMGVEPFLVSSTINIAIGQRLVRKICPKCIQTYETDLNEFEGKVPLSVLEKLARGKDKISLYKGKGCSLCNNTGYHGRLGVFEVLEITDEIRDLIMNNENADSIKKKAIEQGMTTMFEDAIEKVLNGVTTIDEMMRVVKN